jgi:hypothetical protein
MSDIEINLERSGIAEALKACDPKQAYEIIELWYLRAVPYVKGALQARAPARLKGKVRSMKDGYMPHRWMRVYVKSPLAHLLEGGTGAMGVAPFQHVTRHWPSTAGIMRQTGLPKSRAFLVARAIGLRGGNPARPFIGPTASAIVPRVEQMADEAARDVLK